MVDLVRRCEGVVVLWHPVLVVAVNVVVIVLYDVDVEVGGAGVENDDRVKYDIAS